MVRPWIHLHPPRTSLKFGEYSTVEVITPLFELPVKRLDVVFDVYNRDALKREERERMRATECTVLGAQGHTDTEEFRNDNHAK